jgi:holo-[acyl-carrier protein] synthase
VILGVGTDLVPVARLEASLERTPTLRRRLFTPAEAELPLDSLAARFAAKEALAKALGAPDGLSWQDAEVVTDPSGAPRFELRGSVADRLAELGGVHVHLSLSHDAGLALAFVVVEGDLKTGTGRRPR